MNRGRVKELLRVFQCFLASMRPRFMNRGRVAPGRLRCGRCEGFNEAPIHESGKVFCALC